MNLYILNNDYLKITLSDLGASWLSCQVKLRNEQREVLVTTTPQHWHKQTAYFGATIGRYANRIANGRYILNGKEFILAKNSGNHNLHGGLQGADKQLWTVEFANDQAVKFVKLFANGEEGFGGEVTATVEYRLNKNQVDIVCQAISDEDTPFCLTHHTYFNLSGEPTIHQHHLMLNADHFLPVSAEGIPLGIIAPVENTSFNFRMGKLIGKEFLADPFQQAVKGYDHPFQLSTKQKRAQCMGEINRLSDPDAILTAGGIRLLLRTTLPALQLYTGNWLGGQPDMQGGVYQDFAGVALEPEYFPDTPNHPEWWKFGGILKAHQPYYTLTQYQFIAED